MSKKLDSVYQEVKNKEFTINDCKYKVFNHPLNCLAFFLRLCLVPHSCKVKLIIQTELTVKCGELYVQSLRREFSEEDVEVKS